jgi:hypothetical protein
MLLIVTTMLKAWPVQGAGQRSAGAASRMRVLRLTLSSTNSLRVRASDAARLRDLLVDVGVSISSEEAGTLSVSGLTAARVGDVAAAHGITIYPPPSPCLRSKVKATLSE